MILGVFPLRYYEFNLKAQLEGAAEPYREAFIILPRLHACYLPEGTAHECGNSFQRVAGGLWPCGKQPDTIIQQLLRLNSDSG